MVTSLLAYICKDPVSQYGHIHKYQELGYQCNVWGRYKSIHKLYLSLSCYWEEL